MWVKFYLKTTMVVDFIGRPMVAGPPPYLVCHRKTDIVALSKRKREEFDRWLWCMVGVCSERVGFDDGEIAASHKISRLTALTISS
jgi:hypothetical protein